MEIINESNYDEVISNGVVVVDFFATWCGPCRMVSPVLEKLSEEMKNVKFVKVDVDQSPALANRYGIQSIPTILVLKDGQLADSQIGFSGEAPLKNMIEKYIK